MEVWNVGRPRSGHTDHENSIERRSIRLQEPLDIHDSLANTSKQVQWSGLLPSIYRWRSGYWCGREITCPISQQNPRPILVVLIHYWQFHKVHWKIDLPHFGATLRSWGQSQLSETTPIHSIHNNYIYMNTRCLSLRHALSRYKLEAHKDNC